MRTRKTMKLKRRPRRPVLRYHRQTNPRALRPRPSPPVARRGRRGSSSSSGPSGEGRAEGGHQAILGEKECAPGSSPRLLLPLRSSFLGLMLAFFLDFSGGPAHHGQAPARILRPRRLHGSPEEAGTRQQDFPPVQPRPGDDPWGKKQRRPLRALPSHNHGRVHVDHESSR